MSRKPLDVVGIGNAIVDVIVKTNDDFLSDKKLQKGSMTLIDGDQASALYSEVETETVTSGGSAANTIAGIASMGGHGAFIGKVSDDELGRIFRDDICSLGIEFVSQLSIKGPETARCFVFVTDDAERTMNTYLGACADLGPEDVDINVVGAANVTYLEGYLWDPPKAKDAFRKAINIAHQASRLVAFTLSDIFCVERHRTEFLDLVKNDIDILFANEQEIQSLYKVEAFADAVREIRGHCKIAVLTRGSLGSTIVTPHELLEVPAYPVSNVLDTTGAGDLYASGFLFGYSQGADLTTCGMYGAKAASQIISDYGARATVSLSDVLNS